MKATKLHDDIVRILAILKSYPRGASAIEILNDLKLPVALHVGSIYRFGITLEQFEKWQVNWNELI